MCSSLVRRCSVYCYFALHKGFSGFCGFFCLNPRLLYVWRLSLCVLFVLGMNEKVFFIEWVDLGLQNSQYRLNFTKTRLLASRPYLSNAAMLKFYILGRLWALCRQFLACGNKPFLLPKTTLITISHLYTYKTTKQT